MGEAHRRKLAGTYPTAPKGTDAADDDESNRRFLERPDVRRFAESPEGQRLLRPGLLKFMADAGVKPQVDAATGEVVVTMADIARMFGIPKAESIGHLNAAGMGEGKVIPPDRLKPLQ
jgi:hypothetical protein